MIDFLTRQTPLDDCSHFLNVGCGYGFSSKEALDKGYIITDPEINHASREIAQQMLRSAPIADSIEDFSYTTGSLDVILMRQTLEHARDVHLRLSKTHSYLTQNGSMLITVPGFGSLFRLFLQEKEMFIVPPADLDFFSTSIL